MPWQFIFLHFAPILEPSKLSSSDIWPMDHIAMNIFWDGLRDELWGQQQAVPVWELRIVRWQSVTVATGHQRFTLIILVRQLSTINTKRHFSRNQLGGGHHPIILCWILVDNFDHTRYREKLTASGSGQCSVQWQHSASLISATRPPRVTSGEPEEAVLGFVGHTYYQP